ncbi:MAG: hypothetical protein FJZ95_10820 [Chloroflexi bacterium]|nr:hypothetical protein [Chloroflexota bacterium]
MTVVLASIAAGGDAIIMASDKMLTQQDLTYQYEHDGTKIRALGPYLVGYAGTTVFADDIICRGYDTEKPIREFIKALSGYYIEYQLGLANKIVLKSVGLDLEEFNKNRLNYPPQLQQIIHEGIKEVKVGVQLIVCGYDGDEPRIFQIGQDGVYNTVHSVGYAAIGIGQVHVANFYIIEPVAQTPSRS